MSFNETNTGMTLAEFNNEKPGNTLEWRIVQHDYRGRHCEPCFFVYRRKDRGDGLIISEYLLQNGKIDNNCGNGWFLNYTEVAVALIANDTLTVHCGEKGGYEDSYLTYLRRFDESSEPALS